MPPGKGKRHKKASASEWRLLGNLLPLLRSGALQSLLNAAGESSSPKPSLPKRGKAEASETAPVQPGWKVVKKSKEKHAANFVPEASAPAFGGTSLDKLQGEGFQAEVVAGVHALVREKACVCLASVAEAKKAKSELTSAMPMAVLTSQKIDGQGEEVSVLVKDKSDRLQTRVRFLVQLGAVPVLYGLGHVNKGAPAGVIRKQVVIFLEEKKSSSETWKKALASPKSLVDHWLKTVAKIEKVGRIQEPRLSDGFLSVVVAVPADCVNAVLKASGELGVLSRPFWDTEVQPESFGKVVLDLKHDREAALRISGTVEKKAWGIVSTRKGWAIRVLAADQTALQEQLNPAFETGNMYSVSGLPLSWHEENVQSFLGEWSAKPIRSFRVGFRATWLVKASSAPTSETLTNADPLGLHVLAVVSPWRPQSRKPREVLKPATNKQEVKKHGIAWNARDAAPAPARAPAPAARAPASAPAPSAPAATQSQPEAVLPAAALAAIQAAVAAALAPLQSKVNAMNLELQEMGRLPPGVESESEEESEKEAEGMEVDGKSKRPLEEECSNIVTLRRSKMLERPARTPRR